MHPRRVAWQGFPLGQSGGRRGRSAQGISRQSRAARRKAGRRLPAAGPKPVRPHRSACWSPSRTVLRREDYIAPGGVSAAPTVRSTPKADSSPAGGPRRSMAADGPKPPPKGAPAIKLAPLPPSIAACPDKAALPSRPRKSPIYACRSTRSEPAGPAATRSPNICASTSRSAIPPCRRRRRPPRAAAEDQRRRLVRNRSTKRRRAIGAAAERSRPPPPKSRAISPRRWAAARRGN